MPRRSEPAGPSLWLQRNGRDWTLAAFLFASAFRSGKPSGAAELPKHLTASQWTCCAAIKGESQVPVPTAAWSWNPSEPFATPNGAACFNTGGSYAYAHGGISLQECLTPVLVVSSGASNAARAMRRWRRSARSAGRACAATWRSAEPPPA
ncbi:MAG: hypothetical protein ACKN89_03200 [Cyanobium sp.]